MSRSPTCWRFGFAIAEGRRNPDREKYRRELFLYLVDWLDGVDVVDEWSANSRRWIVLETPGPITVEAARSFAEQSPRYIRGSFAVDRSV